MTEAQAKLIGYKPTDTEGLLHDPSSDCFFYKGRNYDRRSAEHNGIVGMGAVLRKVIANTK